VGGALSVACDVGGESVGLGAGEFDTVASPSSPSLLDAPGVEPKSDVRGLSVVH
jgi:hypothetical protein